MLLRRWSRQYEAETVNKHGPRVVKTPLWTRSTKASHLLRELVGRDPSDGLTLNLRLVVNSFDGQEDLRGNVAHKK